MQRQPAEISVEGQKLKVELFLPAQSYVRAVLFLHGWTGKPNTHAAELLANSGYCVLAVTFRGHKGSDGDIKKITTRNSLDDATAAYDFLKSRIPEDTPIVTVGSSYGSYIAVLLTAERKIEAISLRVPANYNDDGLDLPKWGRGHEDPHVAAWRLQKLDPDATASLRALHFFTGKVQILEAELDEIVPSQTVRNYAAAVTDPAKLEYHIMKGWPHSLADNKPRNKEFQTILLDWLKRL